MANIKSIRDLALLNNDKRAILLYSGGLDSTYMLVYLKEELGIDVVSLYVDIGQEEPFSNEDLASRYSSKVMKVDATDEFVKEFALKAITNQGLYLRRHPLSSSLSRPLFAKLAVRAAYENNCNSIIHCATSSQNSLRRYNTAIDDLGFKGNWGSIFELTPTTRNEKLTYLKEKGIIFPKQRNFSFDTNIWCREFESGNLNNPENIEVLEELFYWTRNNNPKDHIEVTIDFKNGVPYRLDGDQMELVQMLKSLNHKVGSFGYGRFTSLEESPTGKKVLEVREAPAAMFVIEAYWELAAASLSQSTQMLKMQMDSLWSIEACEGRWYGDSKKAIEAFSESISKKINGSVTYKVSKNGMQLLSVKSKEPRYYYAREEQESSDLKLKGAA